ncbi:MAG: two-component system response regulator [Leptolyngbyaceae cyanobacterium]
MKQSNITQPCIVAVDDDLDNLWLMSVALELFGLYNICIDQGQYVLEAVKRYQPELVLLDLVLGGISGIEIANQLKAEPTTSHIPIIGITAMVTWEYPKCLPIEVFDGFMTKPYLLDDLQRLVNTYLDKQAPYCLALSA